jgi:tRNA A-37 threonylcarbamoyl transferase component Bud32
MTYSESQLVSRAKKLPVRTLYLMVDGHQRKYFLKKKVSRFPYEALKVWFQIQNPPSRIARELKILELMRQQGIPVASLVAWGELKILGCSIKGFLLVEEVIGKAFIDVYRKSSLRVRRRLFRWYGTLMGVLHRKGIDSKVYPEDLICVSDNYANFRNCFVVIDREHGHPGLVELSIEQCGIRLGNIWVKETYRIGLGERSELLAFLSGYLSEAGWHSGGVERMKLVEQAFDRATEVLYQDHRFANLRNGVQEQYGVGPKTPA